MNLLRLLLFPFAILYALVTSIRNWCFNVGIFKSTSFHIPVIAVGNLSVGGTGKSPQIEYLIRLLKDNYKVAVLSRGYKRKTNGFIQLNTSHNVEDVGDEPLQFYRKFTNEINVAVDADRTNGIQQLLRSENPPEIVLLDDAFQHRKVKAKVYILLTKYSDLYINDFILPVGNLRECRKGAKRANVVIVTKCPINLTTEEQKDIQKKLNLKKYQKTFFTSIEYNTKLKGAENIHVKNLKDKHIVLVTGIANPTPLLNYLTKEKIKFVHLKYADHHYFSTDDIDKINSVFNAIPSEGKLILTTEKDYIRLVSKIDKLMYIEIKTFFLGNSSEKFDAEIKRLTFSDKCQS